MVKLILHNDLGIKLFNIAVIDAKPKSMIIK